MNKNIWVSAIVAFILGFVVAWGIFGRRMSLTPVLPNEEGEATSTEKTVFVPSSSLGQTGEGSVALSDQAAGDAVFITKVTLASGGWIAIREDKDGEPWNTLGAGWVSAGDSENVQIRLLRATTPGSVYYAELRSDDGDRDFDLKKDVSLEDADGKILRVSFETLPETPEAEL